MASCINTYPIFFLCRLTHTDLRLGGQSRVSRIRLRSSAAPGGVAGGGAVEFVAALFPVGQVAVEQQLKLFVIWGRPL